MTRLAAQWIAGWPELNPVAKEQYASEIERVAQMNPYLSQRRIWRSVHGIRFQMIDSVQITVAAACGATTPDPELKVMVLSGFDIDVEGEECKAFGVKTDKGSRLCVVEEAGGRLYEVAAVSPIVGARLSVVGADTIANFARVAQQNLAAEAIDLLLRKLNLDPAAMITALRVSDDRATWCAVTGRTGVLVETLADRGNVIGSDGELLLTVTRAEIEHHAADAAAGQDSLQIPA
ncbi:hypothetical protein [Bradyrhizobium sp. CCBAU 11357]|uniref:hypothetical protein n=1 Tax=Bradyrhizobium sp. CCBAU 11357 TaxID=1630808 RepID=UPI002303F6AE|nr:hypothetical protein [Bradyrhizobium sp. CCBAU 11357]MDA9498274.1 hypothetical protein [Bradyrhizobium sp. CCBAU 11357]